MFPALKDVEDEEEREEILIEGFMVPLFETLICNPVLQSVTSLAPDSECEDNEEDDDED